LYNNPHRYVKKKILSVKGCQENDRPLDTLESGVKKLYNLLVRLMEVGMDNYSLPRRIWRIIYPVLLFVGIQFLFVIAIEVMTNTYNASIEASNGAAFEAGTSGIGRFLLFLEENPTLRIGIFNAIGFAVFFPMWRKTRQGFEMHDNSKFPAIGVLIAFFFAGLNIVTMLIIGMSGIIRYFPSYHHVSEVITRGSYTIRIISVCFTAPIVEELLFRGVLMGRMAWLPAWASVLIQGILFSLVHMNALQIIYSFIAGILLGMAYIRFRSITLVIVGHIAYNLVSALANRFVSESNAWAVIIFSLIAVGLGGYYLLKWPKATLKENTPSSQETHTGRPATIQCVPPNEENADAN